MAYRDKEKQKKYQREWVAGRKNDFFKDKKCSGCHSLKGLELHHRDPDKKEGHSIWSWSEERRLDEIERCDVLCHDCHVEAHVLIGTYRGEKNSNSKISEKDVVNIKKRLMNGESVLQITLDYPVSKYTIYGIKWGRDWSHVKI